MPKRYYHAKKEYRQGHARLRLWELRFFREVDRRVTASARIRRARHVNIEGELLGLLRKINRVRASLRLPPVTPATLLASAGSYLAQ